MPQMTYNLTGGRHGPEGGQTRVWEMHGVTGWAVVLRVLPDTTNVPCWPNFKLPAKLVMAAQQVHLMASTAVARIRHVPAELQDSRKLVWSLHPQVRNVIGSWHLPLNRASAMESRLEDVFFNLDLSVVCAG